MALVASGILQAWSTGSATNGGGFARAGTMDTTGSATSANTASPVFSSSNYSFVAGDVNAWLYIKSGTNCIPGWYQIALVAGGNATLNATAGQAVTDTNTTVNPTINIGPTTATGIATVASPSSITWAIDYNQQASAQFSGTNLAVDATTNTKVTSATHTFTQADVGNYINVSAGASWTTGWYRIVSVASGAATLDRSPAATSTTGGTWALGGAIPITQAVNTGNASVSGNVIAVKATGTNGITAGLTTIAGSPGTPTTILCYTSLMGDGGQATLQLSSGTGITLLTLSTLTNVHNLIVDGNSLGTSTGILVSGNGCVVDNCLVKNCTTIGVSFTGTACTMRRTSVTACSGTAAVKTTGSVFFDTCPIYANTTVGVLVSFSTIYNVLNRCRIYANSGGSSDGIDLTSGGNGATAITDCVIYNNGRDGIRMTNSSSNSYTLVQNTVIALNSGFGINSTSTSFVDGLFYNNAYYNNTSGSYHGVPAGINDVALSGDPFVNGASGNFALNNTAGAGLACQTAGFPGTTGDPLGLTADYTDIGCAQHQCTAAAAPVWIEG